MAAQNYPLLLQIKVSLRLPTTRMARKVKIEIVGKLRQLGLRDEQIAEVLGLALEVVKQID